MGQRFYSKHCDPADVERWKRQDRTEERIAGLAMTGLGVAILGGVIVTGSWWGLLFAVPPLVVGVLTIVTAGR